MADSIMSADGEQGGVTQAVMPFPEALVLVQKAATDSANLNFDEAMKVNVACAIVALEYLRIRDRIMPA